MSNNRNDAFIKIEKNTESIESYKDFPLVFLMKDKTTHETAYSEMYVGMLDCIEGKRIYLKDAYEIDGNSSTHIENEFKKWDLNREDPTIEEFPNIKLDFIESVYACKCKFTLEQAWNVWSDPRDLFKTEDTVYQKIQDIFRKNEANFTENSKPVYLNEKGNRLSLKQIFDIESVDENPVSLIAVTRHQYDISKFPEYEKYIKNELKYTRIYYGLWPDSKKNKVEYDVLYVIPTNDPVKIQRHLNLHNDLNDGVTQEMALVIYSDGEYKVIRNSI